MEARDSGLSARARRRPHPYNEGVQPLARLDFGTGRRRVSARVFGREDAPPVLLVHGLCGSARWWRRNVAALLPTHRVLVVELAGYGTNRAPLPIRIADAVESLAGLIATLPEGRTDIVAHSMGGQIVTHLAARHPDRVNRLVLASASGGLGAGFGGVVLRLPWEALKLKPSFAPVLAFDALRCGPVNLVASTLQIVADDVAEDARRIVAPTLLVWGSDDRLVPVAVGRNLAGLIPDAHLEVVDGAGHVVLWDAPERFNALMTAFLEPTPVT